MQPISSRLEEKKDTDELFLFVDDVASIERYSVHLRAPKEVLKNLKIYFSFMFVLFFFQGR